jgi:DNA-directed RNA polymerase specialized sigma24 family protein
MEATRDEIKSGFENFLQPHNRTFEKWLASADYQLYKYRLRQYETPHDIVNALYVKFMDGQRKWDKAKCPDFIQFVFKAIQSHVKNLARTQKVYIEIDDQCAITVWNERNNPLHREEFIELCMTKLKDDEKLLRIFNSFSDGLANRDVAKDLNMNIREVRNAKKRIIRKLQPVYEEYFKKSKE